MNKDNLRLRLVDYLRSQGIEVKPGVPKPKINCFAHDDQTASLIINVDENTVKCFGCGFFGDVFKVAGHMHNLERFPDQLKKIADVLGVVDTDTYKGTSAKKVDKFQKKEKPKPRWVSLSEEQAEKIYNKEYFEGLATRNNWGKFTKGWLYRSAKGEIELIDVRFDKPDDKNIVSFWYDGERVQSKAPPVKLYNRDQLALHPDKPVLIVEGCKAAQAASVLDKFVTVTWNGGTGRVGNAQWGTLRTRDVYIYPDDDQKTKPRTSELLPEQEQAGIKAALYIKEKRLPRAKIIEPPKKAREVKASGADVVEALEVMTPEELTEYILNFDHEDYYRRIIGDQIDYNTGKSNEELTEQIPHTEEAVPLIEEIEPPPSGDVVDSMSWDACFDGLTKESSKDSKFDALQKFGHKVAPLGSLKRQLARSFGIETLKGLGEHAPAKIIDGAIWEATSKNSDKSKNTSFLADVEPWPDPVDGVELLDSIVEVIKKHIVMADGCPEAIALWILHSHAYDVFHISPVLAITSPEKRCGKSTTLDILEQLTPRPLNVSNITAAALFRTVEKYKPTFLIDESDTFLKQNEELQGILNSGHKRSSAQIIRTVGDDHEPRLFSTWCPKAIAKIGKMLGPLGDRSITIAMRRKMPQDKVSSFRADRVESFIPLCRKAARWAADNIHKLKEIDPQVPNALHDRAADNWRPLLAVADIIGRRWPKTARTIAVLLSSPGEDDGSIKELLLKDIRDIFNKSNQEKIFSRDLVKELTSIEDQPWSEWKKGKPITQNQLASLLKQFEIRPNTKRIGSESAKGYKKENFTDAFNRYLLPSTAQEGYQSLVQEGYQPVTPSQLTNDKGLSHFQPVTASGDVTDGKHGKPLPHKGCDGVTDQKTPSGVDSIPPIIEGEI